MLQDQCYGPFKESLYRDTGVIKAYIGIMEKKMETIEGLGFKVIGIYSGRFEKAI